MVESAETMSEAQSPSPSNSSPNLNNTTATSPGSDSSASAALPPSPPLPPPPKCLNCNNHMRIDDGFYSDRERSEPLASVTLPRNDDLVGKPQNLMALIMDARVPMETPICKECADTLQSGMTSQLSALEDDCLKYRKLIDELKANHSNLDVAECRAAIEKLKREEAELTNELRALIIEEERVDQELANEQRSLEQTTDEENALWARLRDAHTEVIKGDEDTQAINLEYRYAEAQLKSLARTSVLNLAFPIDIVNAPESIPRPDIARINGFRLGRLPDVPVDWPEVCAAWGHAALLLDILMERAGVSVPDTTLVPLGSYSSVRVCKDGGSTSSIRDLPLYATGNWRPFGNKNMDAGAVKFLGLLQALLTKISKEEWPHRIVGDKLVEGGSQYSVKMQFNAEERWTRAMCCMLRNLKWAITKIAPKE